MPCHCGAVSSDDLFGGLCTAIEVNDVLAAERFPVLIPRRQHYGTLILLPLRLGVHGASCSLLGWDMEHGTLEPKARQGERGANGRREMRGGEPLLGEGLLQEGHGAVPAREARQGRRRILKGWVSGGLLSFCTYLRGGRFVALQLSWRTATRPPRVGLVVWHVVRRCFDRAVRCSTRLVFPGHSSYFTTCLLPGAWGSLRSGGPEC